MSGYSGTPLAKKLGIKAGARVALLAAPDGLEAELAPLPERVKILRRARGPLEVILFFTDRRAQLRQRYPAWPAP